MNIANADGATVRADLNNALQALATVSSGAAAPATTFAYMLWADTTNGKLMIRNAANSAWIEVGTLASQFLGIGVPSGTRMLFQQTTAPTGWTKETSATYNDAALRIVTGSVTTGGADAFSAHFGTGKSTAGHTLAEGEIPSHTHTPGPAGQTVVTGGGGGAGFTSSTRVEAGLTIANTGGGGAHSHTLNNFNVKFADCIIASRD